LAFVVQDPCLVLSFGLELCIVAINNYGIVAFQGELLVYTWCLLWYVGFFLEFFF
jgi:hypothetical protein